MYHPHQIRASDEALSILLLSGCVLVAGEPRVGKTRTAIRMVELSPARNALVLTKKAAIKGWQSEIDAVKPEKIITVTNYEQAPKLLAEFDLVILDESHNLGKVGKPNQRFKAVKAITWGCPIILLSGTPTVESALQIYHQTAVSKHSPFKQHKNFYSFFREYGIPDPVWVQGRSIEQYKKAKPALEHLIDTFTVKVTQSDAGISAQANDVVHTVELDLETEDLIREIVQEGVAFSGGRQLVFDTDMGVRMAVHQIESGALLYEDELLLLDNGEVVAYILDTWGDSHELGLMVHYRSTKLKLRQWFKKASIYSSQGDAEGVDLSALKHFVIVNTGFSGAKHVQRRDRITNMNVTDDRVVHHIVTSGGISSDVYQAVSLKRDYNLAMFRRGKV